MTHSLLRLLWPMVLLAVACGGDPIDEPATCGNGVVDPGETCDGDCPSLCDDSDPCTSDSLTGDGASCDAACVFTPISTCEDGDGCCPEGCIRVDDDDCAPECVVTEAGWTNESLPAQSGLFVVDVAAIAGQDEMNGLLGLSSGAAATWDDVAVSVRFNETGAIDVRNGDAFDADVALPYSAESTYQIQLSVDVPGHRYSVTVTPEGAAPVLLAADYSFRSTQLGVTGLDNWTAWNDEGFSLSICDLRVSPGAGVCGNGVVEDDEVCDDGNTAAGDCCSSDCSAIADHGVECRAAVGECDVAEVCDGLSGLCPADEFAPAGTPCERGVCNGPRCGFRHPGVLVTVEQLDFVKAQVEAGAEPWTEAFDAAARSRWGSPTYTPSPFAIVECGPYNDPDIGCGEELNDSTAAYTQALLWYLTEDTVHADNAVDIMNAWSETIVDHTNSNAPLMAAWVASVWARAGEIIRYTYPEWSEPDAEAFGTMLRSVYLPEVIDGTHPGYNGNWELSMIEAIVGIGVYLDDQSVFETGVEMWRRRVPAYVYLESDGPQPVAPPGAEYTDGERLISFWHDQSTFVDGLSQETCRDFGHTAMGFAALIDAAETARIQGLSLYEEEQERIVAGMEFHMSYVNGAAVPSWLCGGTLDVGTMSRNTYEIGYTQYALRQGLSLPQTRTHVLSNRPTGVGLHIAWETLTHGDLTF